MALNYHYEYVYIAIGSFPFNARPVIDLILFSTIDSFEFMMICHAI